MRKQPATAKYYPLKGGLDVTSPALSVRAGTLLECVNFAPDLTGGYRMTGVYERLDGQPRPSDAAYTLMAVADTSTFTVGDALTGGTSGATAVVAAINATNNQLIYTKLAVSTFVDGETVGASTITSIEQSPDTPTESATYLLAAGDQYRSDIAAVPGSGPIRGIWQHEDATYAFRDNAGGTAVDVYKASAAGWAQITLSTHTVRYDAGSIAFAEGDTVTGLSSSATGTVHRVVIHGGSTVGTDEYGYLVLTSVTGTFTDNEALQVSAVTNATADGASVAFSFLPGGRFDFRSYNFLATATTYYFYGCDGVNPAFEVDNNDVFSPVLMSTLAGAPTGNTPHLIEIHRGHLFLAFPNGIIQHSTPGDALSFSGVLGAAEFGMGAEITGMFSVAGGVLMLWTRRNTKGLYGTNVTDWSLRPVSDDTGAVLWGAVPIGRIYAWDDQGIVRLDRVQAFGDFQGATISTSIQSKLAPNINSLVASVLYREKNQFWYVLNTGDVLFVHINQQGNAEFGWGLLPFKPNVAYNAPDETGTERLLIGGDDGFVYEMNKGTSHDGEPMLWAFRTTYNHFGSPRMRKAFRYMGVEIDCDALAEFFIALNYDYSNSYAPGTQDQDVAVIGGEGLWNTVLWNQFLWSAQSVPDADIAIEGTGVNMEIIVHNTTNLVAPFTVQGFMVHFINRRLHRT